MSFATKLLCRECGRRIAANNMRQHLRVHQRRRVMAKAAAVTVVTVNGVKMGEVDEKHLAKVVKKLGLEVDAGDKPETLVTRLAMHFAETVPANALIPCDDCGGKSPKTLDACPFCGAPDEVSTATVPSALAGTAPATALATAPKSDLVPASKLPGERDLDQAVQQVVQLKSNMAVSHWALGAKINEIHLAKLWVHRKNADGKAAYKTWDAFCANELGFTPTHAYELMDVANNFSQVQVAAWGYKKLAIVCKAPKGEQPRLLERVGQGATKREMAEEVKKAKQEVGHRRQPRSGGTGGGAKGGESGVKNYGGRKPAEERITVASVLGRVTVKLYQKPTTKKFDVADLKPAKRFADVPFGEEVLANGVVQRFVLTEDSQGRWQLVVTRTRPEPAAE